MLRNQHLRNVEFEPTLTHFIWNGLDTIQYQIIQGDYEDIAKLIPKREYVLFIADIPHGFIFLDIGYIVSLTVIKILIKWLRAFKKSQHHHFGDL